MTLHRTFSILAIVAAASLPATAWACGIWYLDDEEKDRRVAFYVVSMESEPRNGAGKKKRLGWFRHEAPKLCQQGEKKLTVRGGRFLSGDVVAAAIKGSTLQLENNQLDISVKPAVEKTHERLDWDVEVKRSGRIIARGQAMSFAGCSASDLKHKEEEIRERVACYLILSRRR
jgi:hypothetical protein